MNVNGIEDSLVHHHPKALNQEVTSASNHLTTGNTAMLFRREDLLQVRAVVAAEEGQMGIILNLTSAERLTKL